jgi:hypothetical protein
LPEPLRHGSSLRRVARAKACQRARPLRGWRAEKRKPMVSAILADHGGRLSARHMRSSSKAVAHAICGVFCVTRRAALFVRRMADPSASSWQGLVMDPGGAPAPPECPAHVKPNPQASLLAPLHDASRSALNGRGGCSVSASRGAGITGGQDRDTRHSGVSRNPERRQNWIPAFTGMTNLCWLSHSASGDKRAQRLPRIPSLPRVGRATGAAARWGLRLNTLVCVSAVAPPQRRAFLRLCCPSVMRDAGPRRKGEIRSLLRRRYLVLLSWPGLSQPSTLFL